MRNEITSLSERGFFLVYFEHHVWYDWEEQCLKHPELINTNPTDNGFQLTKQDKEYEE